MRSSRVTALSTSQPLDLRFFGNYLPKIFRPLASKNTVTLFLVGNSVNSKQMKDEVKRMEHFKTVKPMGSTQRKTEATQ
jgi:hypothetical protein